MKLTKKNLLKFKPCNEAIEFLKKHSTLKEAWNNCENSALMWSALRRFNLCTKELSITFSSDCARQARQYEAEYAAAADAADAAADAADAASYAATSSSTSAAVAASYAAFASNAASYAAYTTAYAAYAADATAYATAYYKERKRQADFLRSIINPFKD